MHSSHSQRNPHFWLQCLGLLILCSLQFIFATNNTYLPWLMVFFLIVALFPWLKTSIHNAYHHKNRSQQWAQHTLNDLKQDLNKPITLMIGLKSNGKSKLLSNMGYQQKNQSSSYPASNTVDQQVWTATNSLILEKSCHHYAQDAQNILIDYWKRLHALVKSQPQAHGITGCIAVISAKNLLQPNDKPSGALQILVQEIQSFRSAFPNKPIHLIFTHMDYLDGFYNVFQFDSQDQFQKPMGFIQKSPTSIHQLFRQLHMKIEKITVQRLEQFRAHTLHDPVNFESIHSFRQVLSKLEQTCNDLFEQQKQGLSPKLNSIHLTCHSPEKKIINDDFFEVNRIKEHHDFVYLNNNYDHRYFTANLAEVLATQPSRMIDTLVHKSFLCATALLVLATAKPWINDWNHHLLALSDRQVKPGLLQPKESQPKIWDTYQNYQHIGRRSNHDKQLSPLDPQSSGPIERPSNLGKNQAADSTKSANHSSLRHELSESIIQIIETHAQEPKLIQSWATFFSSSSLDLVQLRQFLQDKPASIHLKKLENAPPAEQIQLKRGMALSLAQALFNAPNTPLKRAMVGHLQKQLTENPLNTKVFEQSCQHIHQLQTVLYKLTATDLNSDFCRQATQQSILTWTRDHQKQLQQQLTVIDPDFKSLQNKLNYIHEHQDSFKKGALRLIAETQLTCEKLLSLSKESESTLKTLMTTLSQYRNFYQEAFHDTLDKLATVQSSSSTDIAVDRLSNFMSIEFQSDPIVDQYTDHYYQTLIKASESQINQRWHAVMKTINQEQILSFFPFNLSGKPIPIEKFDHYFMPGGVLDQFFNQNIRPLTDTSSDEQGLIWKRRQKQPLPFDDSALSLGMTIDLIRKSFYPDKSSKTVQLQGQLKLLKTPSSIKSVVIEEDGKREALPSKGDTPLPLHWPQSKQVKLLAETDQHKTIVLGEASGAWALLQLLSEFPSQSQNLQQATLPIDTKLGKLVLNFETAISLNPISLPLTRQLNLPASLVTHSQQSLSQSHSGTDHETKNSH